MSVNPAPVAGIWATLSCHYTTEGQLDSSVAQVSAGLEQRNSTPEVVTSLA
jgi:hypothetical protein